MSFELDLSASKISDCCGSLVYDDTDICTDCKEHCTPVCPICLEENCKCD